MSGGTGADPRAALALLRERYRAGSGRTIDAVRTLARRFTETPEAADLVDALRRELHRIRGTAGSYGFHDVSALAAEFEPRARAWADEPAMDRDRRAAMVSHLADAMAACFADAPERVARRRMVLIDLPDDFSSRVRAQAGVHGYTIVTSDAAAWAENPLRAETHVAVAAATALPIVRAAASAANVPLIALESADASSRVSRRDSPADGTLVVQADDDPDALFALAEQAATRAMPTGATLLVLDDDPGILELVRTIVEPDGLHVVTLSDPAQLEATLDRVRPTVLLCDVQMQEYDGTALVRGLREDPEWASLPVMLFSTEADASRRATAYAAMADDFIAKPVVPAELTRRLRARIEAVRLRRLSEGRHPGTGLALPQQAERAITELLAASAAAGSDACVAVVRPDGRAPTGSAARLWMAEGGRIARLLGGERTVAGMGDEVALLIARAAPPAALAEALATLSRDRPAEAPAWRAGIVARSERDATFGSLRAGAESALETALAQDVTVHVHEASDDARAPDVIVVEDDQALSDMLQFALRSAGFTFRAYNTGTDAIEALLKLERRQARTLVLLDVDLPGIDGHTLHERLRLERPGQFAVVFCSTHGSESEQLRAIEGGAIDWVTKPLSLRVLMAKVRRWRELAGAS
ncbi:MAG: response regulator [Gemmatimonadaceae bacterium]|nr:response regulator [Gemmatimonadaceae bacterium]